MHLDGWLLLAYGTLLIGGMIWFNRGHLKRVSATDNPSASASRMTAIASPSIVAVHEAGHALLYGCLEQIPSDLCVSINSMSHGMTTGTLVREAVDSDWLRWEMLLCLAGREAERQAFSVTTPGCITDFQRWQELARIYLGSGMGGLYFVRPSLDWECQRNEKAISDLLADQEGVLQQFLGLNQGLLQELAHTLERQQLLEREALVGFLKQVQCPPNMPRPRMVVTLPE